MSTYQTNLTSANSQYVNLIEPNDGDTATTYMRLGNDPDGIGHWILLRLPSDIPSNVVVLNSTIKLPEYDSGYRGATALTINVYPASDSWTTSTKFNTIPTYDTTVFSTYNLNTAAPSASSYNPATDYRTGFHPTTYKYEKYEENGDGVFVGYVYFTTFHNNTYINGGYGYFYTGVTTPSYYDTYIKYHTINISNVIQKCINNGWKSVLISFDLSTANNSRKYFKSPINTNTYFQPVFTLDYAQSGCRIKSSGSWGNGIVYTKNAGTWKQGVMYVKSDGVWKPST